jgi:hypothetical protein
MLTMNYAQSEDDIDVTTASTKLLLSDGEISTRRSYRRRSGGLYLQIALHSILLLVSFTFFILSIQVRNKAQCDGATISGECIDKFLKPSLLITMKCIVMHEEQPPVNQRFDGSFDRSSPFKGPPSPAVDKAWDEVLPCMSLREYWV